MDEDSLCQWEQNLNDGGFVRYSPFRELSQAITPHRDRWAWDSYDMLAEQQELEDEKQKYADHYDEYLNHYDAFKSEKQEIVFSEITHQKEENVPMLRTSKRVKKKFPNKNYCRYILLSAFRTMENALYSETVDEICGKHQVDTQLFQQYYSKQRTIIMGYQVLKKELISTGQELEIVLRKRAFKDFLVWYLDNLATKHILLSKKQDTKEYLSYKNEVMRYYVDHPKQWFGNQAEWMQQI